MDRTTPKVTNHETSALDERLAQAIERGLADVEAGRVYDDFDAMMAAQMRRFETTR